MRNIRLWMVVGLVIVLALGALAVPPKNDPQTRTLEGLVMGKGDAPLAGAVVYLKDTRTLSVKSLYTGEDGSYRFSALSLNNDYEIFAEYKGKRSDTKTLSSFDSRPAARINLHIDTAK